MKRVLLTLSVFFLAFTSWSCSTDSTIIYITTNALNVSINDKGAFIDFTDVKTGKNYISKDTLVTVMQIRVANKFLQPKSASAKGKDITLNFDNNVVAHIKVEEKKTHFTLELVSITNKENVELVVWGPYLNTIDKIISETVGVVRGDAFALGIQALNIKTLGGYPWNESDRMPGFDIFKEKDPNNMHPKSDGSVLYRVEAAKPTATGSSLQAYSRNRDKERIFQDFKHERIVAPTYNDGGVIGSKIAIFGCPVEKALETIGKIEIAEGLPHPMIDGEWAKKAPSANAAYLITNFTEYNINKAIEITKKAGLKYLYHYGRTFESWGHFKLYKGEFPNGIEGLKKCVDKAKAAGLRLGTHVLSNFIHTNDAYVTPIPDKRLAKVGSSVITSDINATATEISIKSPDFFNQMKNNSLKTVMIGDELIRYSGVSSKKPWKLLDCQRGAFKTTASRHKSGKEISKLLDHSYKVFLTNAELTIEMSKTIAQLYNKTGMRQISFDGIEGNRSTGLGTYGESLMPYTWYNSLSNDLKKDMIIDASRTTHSFWHIYTRMNWGEPWYAGFRESQVEYRFNNQAYFKRNFMPGMLGWFKMTPETSIEDIQWMLARSAGYDAGYALVLELQTVEKNGNFDEIMKNIGDWEKLRISNSFTEEQKKLMQDNTKEFSIERINDNTWNWKQIYSKIYTHEKKVRQPGEPLYSNFEFDNPEDEQTVNFSITANKCNANGITIEINNYKKIKLLTPIKKGQTLKSTGENEMALYNSKWQIIGTYKINSSDFKINKGKNSIAVDCNFKKAEKDANLKVEVRIHGKNKKVTLKN